MFKRLDTEGLIATSQIVIWKIGSDTKAFNLRRPAMVTSKKNVNFLDQIQFAKLCVVPLSMSIYSCLKCNGG